VTHFLNRERDCRSDESYLRLLGSVFVAFYYGNLTFPSQDQPRIGLLSTVPTDAVQRLQAAVQLANATLGGNFPGEILCCQTTPKLLTLS
jgi:hypothetical protein